MNMKSWCKIIEVLDNQVLFYTEPEVRDDGRDCECLHQVVRTQGVCADIKIGGIPVTLVGEFFRELNEKDAENVVRTVEDKLENQNDIIKASLV